jgi:ABC-type glycerol-3-phosphate transport system permease component
MAKPVLVILSILLIVIALFPIAVMLSTSVKPSSELMSSDAGFLPHEPTLKNYRFLFNIPDNSPLSAAGGKMGFVRMILNTLLYALLTSCIAIPLAIFAAYGLAKIKYKYKSILIVFLLFCYLLPTVAIIVPMFLLLSKVGLYNSICGLIITYQILVLPLDIWMLVGYFKNIPNELVEAALVDGSSYIKAIIKIFVPVSAPGIAAVITFSIIVVWQEFMYNLILIKSDKLRNVQVGMQSFFQYGLAIDWGVVMAASTLVALPIAILFAYMRQYLIGGLAVGAIKG